MPTTPPCDAHPLSCKSITGAGHGFPSYNSRNNRNNRTGPGAQHKPRNGAGMNVPQLQSPTQSHSSPAIKAVQVLWRQISQALQKGLQNNSIYHPTNRLANKFANTVGVLVAMNDGKVWIVRRRCHHGLFGAFTTTIGALTRRPELVAVGSYWMWDDRKDWPWPMSKFSLR